MSISHGLKTSQLHSIFRLTLSRKTALLELISNVTLQSNTLSYIRLQSPIALEGQNYIS